MKLIEIKNLYKKGEVEKGNESKLSRLLQIYAKESNNSNSGTETNTGDPEYGGEL